MFNPGFDIKPTYNPLGFNYGLGVFGPNVENRRLEDIRKSLLNPNCDGPEVVYSIAMDIGKFKDKNYMVERNLLYGAVTYAAGQLGKEPIRSQGHIHSISKFCNTSTPELYEIWAGEAIIYMQETAKDNPGRCFAVYAKKGEKVLVPPSWAHCTISANPNETLTFGAWCVRDYSFEYEDVRNHKGLAWYPLIKDDKEIDWIRNDNYEKTDLIIKTPREYKEFGIKKEVSIYCQFEEDRDKFLFISNPSLKNELWENFIP